MPATEAELAPPSIEAPYVIAHFFGKTRDAVEADSFPASLYMEDFTYMTDAAVAYYLPSVLRIMVARPDDELWIFLRGFLRDPSEAFTPDQRAAIAGWAEYCSVEWKSHAWMASCTSEAAKLAATYRNAPARSC